jgi:hypothetical protein
VAPMIAIDRDIGKTGRRHLRRTPYPRASARVADNPEIVRAQLAIPKELSIPVRPGSRLFLLRQ